MARSEAYNKWIEAGYELFAHEGPEGLQVEKLARTLVLNKSGFYHYFGDLENFSKRMIKYHEQRFEIFLHGIPGCKIYDPDYINLLIEHRLMVMAHVQLVKCKSHPWFAGAHTELDEKVGHQVLDLWSEHVNIRDNPKLAFQYHSLVRDMFYSRITWENFHFDYLKNLADEIYDMAIKILSEKERLAENKRDN